MRNATIRLVGLLLLGGGLLTLASGAIIPAKAWLAQILLDEAWQRAEAGAVQPRPWPWADHWPVARLIAGGHGIDQLVLSDGSGAALAFGPGWTAGDPRAQESGATVLAGHRDTHFRFLQALRPGDMLALETASGVARRFRVASRHIADIRRQPALPMDRADTLYLVTCYPFDAPGAAGPLRYIVRAQEMAPRSASGVASNIAAVSAGGGADD